MRLPRFASGGRVDPSRTSLFRPDPQVLCTYTLPDTSRSEAARNLLAKINDLGDRMHLPELPDEIQSEDIVRALEFLGIAPDKNFETAIRYGAVEVTYFRTDADGEILAGSKGASKVTTTIPVRYPKRAT
ncbi:hypothetical protein SEA_NEOBUSH_79 [Gordonia phage Neobush]|uniref:Uncharacterized protein n=8 Tax=Nymphadoravirus TaxID=2169636 RepID=A0A4Y5U0I7_9CAUD|nr:hypothetical protein SEA_KITA_78 [Gordonia phage Kita]YP_010653108.1 hypothetical protein PP489_gp74 [Gordonia phage Polly]QCG77495.1 hypothetical protein SEA_ANTONIO_76 [Gordonia phage Antonio]QCW22478.1 hypothetical protein SEA_TAYONIA_77 [Gordonia phage Tayonia]QDF16558.1 hypothetical protein SEA_ZAMEEN_77 [Gordonia phage Zameen]QDH48903.1 hypothetical protein SEA_SUSCEPIT_77 [Gordonia phage Suscepit]QUE26184.1 hypothetical protein SEA_TRUMPET_77 [Gordonia phage Trumpet]QUE26364.1 hypo